MDERFIRSAMLLGEDNIKKLNDCHVAVFGIGGVGGYVAEALARCGVGHIDLIDKDTVSISNINRQLIALTSTVSRPKVEVMKERILDINPSAEVNTYNTFYLPDTANSIPLEKYDYIADAVDNITAKLELALRAGNAGVSIISAMGAGNKLDPTGFLVADIFDTTDCPLARVMRKELKQRNIDSLKVVYSKEKPQKPLSVTNEAVPGSLPFVPSVMGLIMAGEIIKDLCKV